MATVARAESPLYLQIAESMTQQVARGALRPGDRVPSLRRLSRQRRVSMSTALQAYLWLESRGYLEARRRQIARRSPDMGCNFSPRDITVTCGALEALSLSLRAVAKPGDVIAMESPTYFGILESAASLGMKIIEIPTNPQSGMDLNQLEAAIRKPRVKACVVMTNSHNPLGYVLPDHYKKALVDVTARWNVPLIEDDTYGDLAHQDLRPRTAKSF